nr:unnamed protein product [Naegleria fowleri]
MTNPQAYHHRVWFRLMISLIFIIYWTSSDYCVRGAGVIDVSYQVSNVMTNLESTLYGAVVHPTNGQYLISVVGYVYQIDPTTLVKKVFTGNGAGDAVDNVPALSAKYYDPTQLAAGTRYVYIADSYNYVVRQYDLTTGMVSFVYQAAPVPFKKGMNGVAATKDDSVVFICDGGRSQVIKWTRQNNTSVVVASGLNFPLGLTLTPDGDLFIADTENHVIRKLYANGTLTIFAGTLGQPGFSGDGGPATSALLRFPQGVTYNYASKEVYIVDRHNHAIRKVDANGIITRVAGNGVQGAPGYLDVNGPLFNYPTDMSFHGSKPEFLITDTNNQVLRRLIITCADTKSYVLSSDYSKCLAICYGKNSADPTVCSGNGTCTDPNQCTCRSGYYSPECALYDCYGIVFNDTRVCSGRGSCYAPNNCSCNPNYSGNNCQTYYCYGVVNSNTSGVCSGHGTCSSYNNCTCNPGYYGSNCELYYCNGIQFNSSSVCNGNGTCTAPDTCSCKSGYSGTNCEIYYCNNILSNSSSVCNGKGKCTGPNNCTCTTSGYFGQYCDQFKCYGIVNTDTNNACSGNGTCIAPNVCSCNNGPKSGKYYGDQCQYYNCSGISYNDPNVCSSFGTCVAPDACVCQPGRNGTNCNNPLCFGKQSDEKDVCNGRGRCDSTDKCTCNAGFGGESCQYSICFGLLSNSSEVCSKHGTCIGPDSCQCYPGYGTNTCNVTSCFGISSIDLSVCSSQGKCYELDKCTCYDGFVGNTCQYHGVQLDGSTSVIYSSKKSITSLAPSFSSKTCLELFPEDISLLGDTNNVECKWDSSEFKINLGYGHLIDNMNLLRLTPYNITLRVDTTAANTMKQNSQYGVTLDLALSSYPSGLDIVVRASSNNTYQGFRNMSLSWMCYSSDSSTQVATQCVTGVQNYLSNLANKPIIIIPSSLFSEFSGSVYYRQLPLALQGNNGLSTAFSTRPYSVVYAKVTYPSYNILSDTTIIDQNRFLDCVGESCILEVAPNGASSSMSYAFLDAFATLSSSYEKAQMIRIVNYQPSTSSVFASTYNGEFLVIGLATVPTSSSIKVSYKAYDKINLVMTNVEKSYSQQSNITIGVNMIDPYISNFTPETSTLSYQWSVKDLSLNTEIISQTSSSLQIAAGSLGPGEYKVALSMMIVGDSSRNDNMNVTGTFVGTLTVLNSTITIPDININTVPAISPYGRNLVLTATITSQSACNNVAWTLQSGLLRLTSNNLTSNASISTFISQNTFNEVIYGTNNVVSKLIIPASYLQAETTYVFGVSASNQDGASYARVSTRIDAKPRFHCEIYDPSSKMIAYESQFVIYCTHTVESVSSYLMEVFSNSNIKRMVVLSNTPKRWIIARLPYSPNGITVSVTLINTNGSIAKFQQSLSLNLPSTLAQDLSLTNTLNYVRYSFNGWRGNETLRIDSAVTVSSLFSLLQYSMSQRSQGTITKTTSDALATLLIDMINVLNGIPELGVNVDEKILQLVLTPLRNIYTMLYAQSPSTIDSQVTNIYNWLNYFLNAAGKHSDRFCSSATKSLLLDNSQVTEIVDLFGIWSTKSVDFTKLLISVANLARKVNSMSGNSSTPSIPLQLSSSSALFESVSQFNLLNGKKISLSNSVLIQFPTNFDSQMIRNGLTSSTTAIDILSSVSTPPNENSILSPVVSLSVLSRKDSSVLSVKDLSLSSPITLYFNGVTFMQNTSSMGTSLNLTCFYFDSVSNQWKYDGLSSNFTILKNESGLITYNLMCATTHLTSFSVMNIPQPEQSQRTNKPTTSPNSTDNSGIIAAIVVPILLVLIFTVILVVIGVIVFIVYRRKKAQSQLESVPTSRTIQIELGNDSGLDASFFPSDESVNFKPLSQGSSAGSSGTGFDPMSRYKNFIRIGQGAFGSVFKAEDTRNNKMKALKVIKFTNMEELNTMMKEGTQLMNIEHPNILKVNDFFVDKGNILVIDMDFYEHGDLSKLTAAEFHCSEKIIKQVIYQMCDALDYIHCRMKLIHRDVKPSNIFIKELDEDNIQIVLADFGLAKAQSNNSMNNSYAGTPLFMSPELGLGGKYYANTDIYSLGVAIYQIMTKDTFTSISNIYMAKEPAAVKEWLRTKLQEGQEYSPQLIDITLSMLEKDNLSRPQAQDILSNPYFDDQRRRRKKK